jgi:predicted ATPase
VAPFIRALAPTADRRAIRLEWVDDKGETLGPAQLSDGTLRALALIVASVNPRTVFR